jgi:hypothetical protein
MFGSDSTPIPRYAGWSAYLSAVLGALSTVFLFLFYGLEVPRAIATGGDTHVFGTLNDITGLFQFLFMLPLTVALHLLSSARHRGLSLAAMVLGALGLLTAVTAQALLVAQAISFAVNLPIVLAALAPIGGWMIVASHLGRSDGSLSPRLARVGEATGAAFALVGGLAPVVVLASPNGPLSTAAASFGRFAQQRPVIIAGGAVLAVAVFLAWSLGLLIWLVGLGRRLLAVAAAQEHDVSVSHRDDALEGRRRSAVFTRAMRWAYVVFVWILLAAVVVQFFLAGLGVFGGADGFQAHVALGYSLLFVTLLGLLLAFAARLPWGTIGQMALLPVLVVLQSVFIDLWHAGLPVVAALHPVNGLAIFSLAGLLALRSRRFVATLRPTSPETSVPAPTSAVPGGGH